MDTVEVFVDLNGFSDSKSTAGEFGREYEGGDPVTLSRVYCSSVCSAWCSTDRSEPLGCAFRLFQSLLASPLITEGGAMGEMDARAALRRLRSNSSQRLKFLQEG